jgi:hypothetical protein
MYTLRCWLSINVGHMQLSRIWPEDHSHIWYEICLSHPPVDPLLVDSTNLSHGHVVQLPTDCAPGASEDSGISCTNLGSNKYFQYCLNTEWLVYFLRSADCAMEEGSYNGHSQGQIMLGKGLVTILIIGHKKRKNIPILKSTLCLVVLLAR